MTNEDLAKMMYTDWRDALGEPKLEIPWDVLPMMGKKRWVYVAGMVREPVINSFKEDVLKEINEFEDILDSYRNTLWTIVHLLTPILNLKVVDDNA